MSNTYNAGYGAHENPIFYGRKGGEVAYYLANVMSSELRMHGPRHCHVGNVGGFASYHATDVTQMIAKAVVEGFKFKEPTGNPFRKSKYGKPLPTAAPKERKTRGPENPDGAAHTRRINREIAKEIIKKQMATHSHSHHSKILDLSLGDELRRAGKNTSEVMQFSHVVIQCDACQRTRENLHSTISELRKRALQAGWIRDGNSDYCWACWRSLLAMVAAAIEKNSS